MVIQSRVGYVRFLDIVLAAEPLLRAYIMHISNMEWRSLYHSIEIALWTMDPARACGINCNSYYKMSIMVYSEKGLEGLQQEREIQFSLQ